MNFYEALAALMIALSPFYLFVYLVYVKVMRSSMWTPTEVCHVIELVAENKCTTRLFDALAYYIDSKISVH